MKFTQKITQTSITQGISVSLELILSVILVRYLGPINYGIYAAVFIIPNLITGLGSFGIGPSIIYFSGRKVFNLWAIFYFSILASFFLGLLYLIIFYSISDLMYDFVFTQRIDILFILSASLIIPLNLLNKFSRAILRGLGKVNQFTISTILFPTFLRLVLVLLFVVFFDQGVQGAVIASLVSVLLSSILVLILVSYGLRKIKGKKHFLNFLQIRELMQYGLKSWLGSAVKKSDSGIIMLLVTYFSTLEDLAFFKLSFSLANMSTKVRSIIDIVSVSKIVTSDIDLIKSQFPQLFRVIILLIVILLVLGNIMIFPTIHILYGDEFLKSIDVFRILLPGLLLLQFISIANQVKAYTGKPLYVSKVRTFGLVTNIILLLILLPKYSIYGAASSILTANIIMFFVSIYFMTKFFELKSHQLLVINRKDLNRLKTLFSKFKILKKR